MKYKRECKRVIIIKYVNLFVNEVPLTIAFGKLEFTPKE
jgi:hypothetical protein